MEKLTIQSCDGNRCYSATVQGNNIIIPVLFGIAIGLMIQKSSN